MTFSEKIRGLSDIDLAKFLGHIQTDALLCAKGFRKESMFDAGNTISWLEWLKSEVGKKAKKAKLENRKETEFKGARLYIKYRDDIPVKYAFGEEWVSMALFMDDIGYSTAEEALSAWLREK